MIRAILKVSCNMIFIVLHVQGYLLNLQQPGWHYTPGKRGFDIQSITGDRGDPLLFPKRFLPLAERSDPSSKSRNGTGLTRDGGSGVVGENLNPLGRGGGLVLEAMN